jgi:hypothetical protein
MFKKLKQLFEKPNTIGEKEAASARGEPYVRVVDVNMDENNPGQGYFELDWNEEFVKKLVASGYSGGTQEEIVDAWFTALCRGVAEQDY